jgi:hypothetical protein
MMQQYTFQVLATAAAVAATAAGTLCDPVVIHAPGPQRATAVLRKRLQSNQLAQHQMQRKQSKSND